jgi:hypothetical protein
MLSHWFAVSEPPEQHSHHDLGQIFGGGLETFATELETHNTMKGCPNFAVDKSLHFECLRPATIGNDGLRPGTGGFDRIYTMNRLGTA